MKNPLDKTATPNPSQTLYARLLQQLGPQLWWPGETPFEVMVGAVLVQNTSWKNVERAIEELAAADVLEPRRLWKLSLEDLERLIRPAGTFRIKARRLRGLVEFIVNRYEGSVEQMRLADDDNLRRELLAIHGIGPETADAILLYALHKPAMVVDTYTHRIYARHGLIGYGATYHQLQEHIVAELPVDVSLYNEFHALMVYVGHHHCRKTPNCTACPLQELLPPTGIVEPEGR